MKDGGIESASILPVDPHQTVEKLVSFTEIAEMYPIMAFVPRDPIGIIVNEINKATGTAYLCWVAMTILPSLWDAMEWGNW